jgi:hypothetical protein
MSSSRDFPFNFSLDVRDRLGPPDAFNLAVRDAFPVVDPEASRRWAQTFRGCPLRGAGVRVRPDVEVPADTVLGVFAGTVFLGTGPRVAHSLPLPPVIVQGMEADFTVNGAARATRFPSAAGAELYAHACAGATVVAEWWTDGLLPCLVARAARTLGPGTVLTMDFNAQADGNYTLTYSEALARRRAGLRCSRCRCDEPGPCPRACYVPDPDASDSGEDSDW